MTAFPVLADGYFTVHRIHFTQKPVSSLTLNHCVSQHPPGGNAAVEALWNRARGPPVFCLHMKLQIDKRQAGRLLILNTLLSSCGSCRILNKARVVITALWESLKCPGLLAVNSAKITASAHPVKTQSTDEGVGKGWRWFGG